MRNDTHKNDKLNSSNTSGKFKGRDGEPHLTNDNGAKAIALPLFIFILFCIVVAILKSRYGRRKVGLAAQERSKILEPCENPINIRFKALIGRGSFGVVWKAALDDIVVAVKMCPVEKHERWEKERDILAYDAEHPNVIKMIDSEIRKIKEEIALLIILEFVDNGDLRTYLTENSFNVDRALLLLKSMFDGLAFLHSHSGSYGITKKAIVHRDMKSSNVLISSKKGCVIADFGLALSLNFREKISLQEAKTKVGTARYMAPEKLTGLMSRNNLWRSLCLIDIYASAIVGYEILKRCHFVYDNGKQGNYIPEEFSLPFGETVGSHPSNDDMKRVVVEDNARPSIPNQWHKCKAVNQVSTLLVQCWDRSANKRLTAEEMLERVREIYLEHELQLDYRALGISSNEEESLLKDPSLEVNSNISFPQMNSVDLERSTRL